MKFDFNAIREMLAWLIEHDMPAGYQIQPVIALEEEAARIRQWPLSSECENPCRRQQDGFEHSSFHSGCAPCSDRCVVATISWTSGNYEKPPPSLGATSATGMTQPLCGAALEDAFGSSWPMSSAGRRLASDDFDSRGTSTGSPRSSHRATELPHVDVMRTCQPADPSTG